MYFPWGTQYPPTAKLPKGLRPQWEDWKDLEREDWNAKGGKSWIEPSLWGGTVPQEILDWHEQRPEWSSRNRHRGNRSSTQPSDLKDQWTAWRNQIPDVVQTLADTAQPEYIPTPAGMPAGTQLIAPTHGAHQIGTGLGSWYANQLGQNLYNSQQGYVNNAAQYGADQAAAAAKAKADADADKDESKSSGGSTRYRGASQWLKSHPSAARYYY